MSASQMQMFTLLENRIRNLESKKEKLKLLRDRPDQKYNEIIRVLDFAKDLRKQFLSIVNKEAKKLARKELTEAKQSEMTTVRQVLLVQDALMQTRRASVREDFLLGKNGAVTLSQADLSLLDKLYPSVVPRHDHGDSIPFAKQLQSAVEHLTSVMDGRPKRAFGGTYTQIKEVIEKIHECGYLEDIITPVFPCKRMSKTAGELALKQKLLVPKQQQQQQQQQEPPSPSMEHLITKQKPTEKNLTLEKQESPSLSVDLFVQKRRHQTQDNQQRREIFIPEQRQQQQQNPPSMENLLPKQQESPVMKYLIPQQRYQQKQQYDPPVMENMTSEQRQKIQKPPLMVNLVPKQQQIERPLSMKYLHSQQQYEPPSVRVSVPKQQQQEPQKEDPSLMGNLISNIESPSLENMVLAPSKPLQLPTQPPIERKTLSPEQLQYQQLPKLVRDVLGSVSFYFLQDSEIDTPNREQILSQTFTNQSFSTVQSNVPPPPGFRTYAAVSSSGPKKQFDDSNKQKITVQPKLYCPPPMRKQKAQREAQGPHSHRPSSQSSK